MAEQKLIKVPEIIRKLNRKRNKIIIPNCALIIPQRYKKEHEYIQEIMSNADSLEINQSKNILRLLTLKTVDFFI